MESSSWQRTCTEIHCTKCCVRQASIAEGVSVSRTVKRKMCSSETIAKL